MKTYARRRSALFARDQTDVTKARANARLDELVVEVTVRDGDQPGLARIEVPLLLQPRHHALARCRMHRRRPPHTRRRGIPAPSQIGERARRPANCRRSTSAGAGRNGSIQTSTVPPLLQVIGARTTPSGAAPRTSGVMRTSAASRSRCASIDSRRTVGAAQPPPIQPSMLPSRKTIARWPAPPNSAVDPNDGRQREGNAGRASSRMRRSTSARSSVRLCGRCSDHSAIPFALRTSQTRGRRHRHIEVPYAPRRERVDDRVDDRRRRTDSGRFRHAARAERMVRRRRHELAEFEVRALRAR